MSDAPPCRVLVLRPMPGNAETVERLEMVGVAASPTPLFAVEPVDWMPPPSGDADALLLTSANAVRQGGASLSTLRDLPAWCVGEATAAAARDAGLAVERVGTAGVAALLAGTSQRLLWLCGEQRSELSVRDKPRVVAIPVYRTVELPVPQTMLGEPCVALLHSSRAARRLAGLGVDRTNIAIVAISRDVAAAAGAGWRSVAVAPYPADTEMVAIAAKLCQDMVRGMRL